MSIPQSLHLRLFLPFLLAVVTAVTLSWWIATSMLTRSLEQRLGNQMQRAAEVLIHSGFPLSSDLLRQLASLTDADIALLDARNRIGLSTGSIDTALSRELTGNLQQQLQQPAFTIQVGDIPYKLIVRALPPNRDRRFVTVAVIASLKDIQTTVRAIALKLGLATLAGIALLAWVGHRITISITQPIEQLSQMADAIAGGERALRVEIAQKNELGKLASALNRMAERLQAYEQEIARRNRLTALGEISARIAHEIRNPLTAMKLELQLLSETLQGGARQTSQALLAEVRRLELIAGSTLQAGRSPRSPALRQTRINTPVTEVLELFKGQLAHRRIRLQTALAEDLPPIQTDPDWIKQILVNLLVNAADALPDGGQIQVTTSLTGKKKQIVLSIADSGPGIPPERQADLFRGDNSAKPKGFGIGLALCRELITRLGGDIRLARGELPGACFNICFPVEVAP